MEIPPVGFSKSNRQIFIFHDQLAEPKFSSCGPSLWDLDLYQPLVDSEDFRRRYLREKRALSETTIELLDPHTGPEFDRVYFPVYHDFDLESMSFLGRAVFEEHTPKYKHPRKETLERLGGKSFWGLQYCKSETDLVLVEGVFDACHVPGRLAIMGSSLTLSQIEILQQLEAKSVTVMLDGDALEQTGKILSQLIGRGFKNLYLVRLPWDQDPDSLRNTKEWEDKRESVA